MTPLTMTLDTTKLSRVKKGCNVAWITIIACLLVPWAALFAFHIVENHSALCKNSVFLCSIWDSGNNLHVHMGTQYVKKGCNVAWTTIIACLLVPWAAVFAFHIVKNHSDLCKNSIFFKSLIWGSGNKGLTWRRGLNNTQLY